MPEIYPIEWSNEKLKILDQTKLPKEQSVIIASNYIDVINSIKSMSIRGVSVIGIAAGYALTLAAKSVDTNDVEKFTNYIQTITKEIINARPSVVSLFQVSNRIYNNLSSLTSVQEMKDFIQNEAEIIHKEDLAINHKIAKSGESLINTNQTILTHGNTGALATSGYGTALGVIRKAFESGKKINVVVTETRPFLQGARLTTWELVQLGIPTNLIVDSAAGYMMANNKINSIIVGAHRIARNGDLANEIGTYSLSVIAKENNIPFYVAATKSSIDLKSIDGGVIPIEERNESEMINFNDSIIAPKSISVSNITTDITPYKNISAFITESGIIYPPFKNPLISI
jgi:methylthioribose-1-phosphate isomerase